MQAERNNAECRGAAWPGFPPASASHGQSSRGRHLISHHSSTLKHSVIHFPFKTPCKVCTISSFPRECLQAEGQARFTAGRQGDERSPAGD